MGINGEGIGLPKKTLVFVPGSLKGEDIYCQIISIRQLCWSKITEGQQEV